MTDEEYEARVTELIQATATWARKKYTVRTSGVVDLDDLTGELWVAALNKRDKLQPRLEAGEVGYVVTTLRRAAHDALEPEWKVQAKAHHGTLEDLEENLHSEAPGPTGPGRRPRMAASKSPSPPPVRILRTAAESVDRALDRVQQQRAAAVLMTTLDPVDAEILRLHLGSRFDTGANAKAIALELVMPEGTVGRRLAAIKKRLRAASEMAEPSLLVGDG